MDITSPPSLLFGFVCDKNYYHLAVVNLKHIRLLYPRSQVIIYDVGLNKKQIRAIRKNHLDVHINSHLMIDRKSVNHFINQQYNNLNILVTTHLSRSTSLYHRLLKKLYSLYPDLFLFKKHKYLAARAELCFQKKINAIKNMIQKNPGKNAIFLDADAIPFKKIDEIFNKDFDIGMTIFDKDQISLTKNDCYLISGGVFFFKNTTSLQIQFLSQWLNETKLCQERFREQTALSRYLLRNINIPIKENTIYNININNMNLKILIEPCHTYNYFRFNEPEQTINRNAKIYHFSHTNKEKGTFYHLYKKICELNSIHTFLD